MQPLREEVCTVHTILQVLVILIIDYLISDIWKYKDRYDSLHYLHSKNPQCSILQNKATDMQFKIVSVLAFVTLVTATNGPSGPTILPPFPGNPLPTVRKSNCNYSGLACCRFYCP